mgnify:FL=1
MTFIIRAVELEGFLSHDKTSLSLPEGSVAFVGENGAGKTSIFEAINYAMTLSGWRGKPSELVMFGRPRARVRLVLEDVDSRRVVEAHVTIERRGKGASSSAVLKVDNKVVATTVSAFQEELAKLLGLHGVADYGDFVDTAIIIRQGGLREMADVMARGGKRLRELLESAIGIPQLQAAIERVRSHTIRALRDDGSVVLEVDVGPRKRDSVLVALQKARERRQELSKLVRQLEEEVGRLEPELERASREVEAVSKERDEACRREAELGGLERQLDELRSRLGEARSELARLQAEEGRLSRQLEELERLAPLAQLRAKLEELEADVEELRAVTGEEERLRPLVDAWRELQRLKPVHEEYEAVSKQLAEVSAAERESSSRLGELKARLEEAKSTASWASSTLKDLLGELGVNAEAADVAKAFEAAKGALAALRKKEAELAAELSAVEAEAAAASRLLQQVREARRLLGGASEPRCPVCGSPLSRERLDELLRHYGEEESKLERRVKELSARAEAIRAELDRTRQVLGRVEPKLLALEGVLQKISDLPELERAYRDEEARLGEASSRRRELERRLKELEAGNLRFVALAQQLAMSGIDDRKAPELEERLRALAERRAALASAVASLEEELKRSTGAASVDEAKKVVEKAREAAILAEATRSQLAGLRELRSNVEAQVRGLELREQELERAVEELRAARARCKELTDRLNEAMKVKEGLALELSSKKARLDEARRSLDQVASEQRALEEALGKLDAALGSIEILGRLEKALYRRALVALENNMNEVFKRFGLEYARVEVRETEDSFEFVIVDRQGNERQFSSLSGGEQVVVALAFTIALNKMMRTNVGFLLLDEPTDMLDYERRRALVDVLGRLTEEGVVRQLLVITHHEDIVDSLDKVCRVEKTERGTSVVRCEGEGP